MSETQIDSIIIEIEAKSNNAANEIDKLTKSLENLKNAGSFGRTVNNLNKLRTTLDGLKTTNAGLKKLQNITTFISELSGINKASGLSYTIRTLKKIPEITKSLDTQTVTQFATSMKKVSEAIAPLATQINTLSTGFGRLPNRITSCVTAANRYTNSTKRATFTSNTFANRLKMFLGIGTMYRLTFAAISQVIGNSINNMNDYVENVNLFTVSMGKYADKAMEYAEKVQRFMGIDLSEWIRNQGIFMNMAAGFGLAEEKAYQLSKGLTELAYDISSFYNVNVETAFQRLQSGIAGEIEPVRRWGIALDQASMKEWLLKKGIDANVTSLQQADKAIIRYNMMVETMSRNGAVGDFARTLITPANAIRILQQQITQLSRAFGSLFIPILIKVIPYVQAFVTVLREAIQTLATFFGFELPKIDYSGISGLSAGASDAADSLGKAASNAKKLKDYTMGFDELNIISPNKDTGGAAGNVSGGASLGLTPETVWNESIFDGINSKIEELKGKMKVLLGIVTAIGSALLIWKIGDVIISGVNGLTMAFGALKNAARGARDFIMLLSGHTLVSTSAAVTNLATALGKVAKFFTTGIFGKGLGALLLGNGASSLTVLATTAASIGLIGAGLYDVWKNSEHFRNGIQTIFEFIGETIDTAISKFKGLLKALGIDIEFTCLSELSKQISEATDGFLSLGDIAIAVGGIALFGGWGLVIEGVILAIKGIGWAFEEVENEQGEMVPRWELLWDNFKNYIIDGCKQFVTDMKSLWEQIKRNTSELWTSIKDTVSTKWNEMKTAVSTKATEIKDAISGKWEDIKKSTSDKWNFVKETITNALSKVAKGIKEPINGIIGGIEWMINGLVNGANRAIDALNNLFKLKIPDWVPGVGGKEWSINLKHIQPITLNRYAKGGVIEDGLFTMNKGEIAGKFNNGKSVVANNMQIIEGIKQGVIEGVNIAIGSSFKEQMPLIVNSLTTTKLELVKLFGDLKQWFIDLNRDLQKCCSDISANIGNSLNDLKNEFVNLSSEMSSIKSEISNVKAQQSQISDLQSQLSSTQAALTEATGTKTVTTSKGIEVTVSNSASKTEIWNAKVAANAAATPGAQLYTGSDGKLHYTTTGVKKYATGGFIEDGLFTMNEGEIAGKFNNGKSVVANNMQIIEGISQGVYRAMMQAQQENGEKPLEVNVYLDGRKTTSSVNKINNEKGRTLLGDGLGYNY